MGKPDQIIKINQVDYGIFEGEVECPYTAEENAYDNPMQFRFLSDLPEWIGNSFGAYVRDSDYLNVDMTDSPQKFPIIWGGQFNWGLANWRGGVIKMRVDLIERELTLTDVTASVHSIDTGESAAEEVYYNMQGIRVNKPQQGLVIRHKGSNVEKIFIRSKSN